MATPFLLKPDFVTDISGNDPGAEFLKAAPRPYGYMVRGSFARYPGNGVYWSTVEVSQDELMTRIFAATRGSGTRVGAYAYMLQGRMDQQVEVFLQSMKAAGILLGGRWLGELPPAADVEVECDVKRPKKLPRHWVEPIVGQAWADQVHYFLRSVEQATGVRPWIYTARPQWKWLLKVVRSKEGKLDWIAPTWTKDYLFWVKWYADSFERIDANTVLPVGALPTGVAMEQVVLWQYHDKGKTHGFQYNDLNTMSARGKELYDAAGDGGGSAGGDGNGAEDGAESPIEVPAKAWAIVRQDATHVDLELR